MQPASSDACDRELAVCQAKEDVELAFQNMLALLLRYRKGGGDSPGPQVVAGGNTLAEGSGDDEASDRY